MSTDISDSNVTLTASSILNVIVTVLGDVVKQ
jgi:hypothetical protein